MEPEGALRPNPLDRRLMMGRRHRRRRHRLRLLADFERVDVDRLGDVFQLGCAEVRDLEIEPAFHLPIGLLGQTDRAGPCDAFQPRGDIDAIAHQVAVALLDHIAEVDADPKLDPPFGADAGVAVDESGLHFDRTPHRFHNAQELDQHTIARRLDNASAIFLDFRIDQLAVERLQTRKRALLVRAHQPAEADDVRGKNLC